MLRNLLSAAEALNAGQNEAGINLLDHFFENYVQVRLSLGDQNNLEFIKLDDFILNTQYQNRPSIFQIENVFKVQRNQNEPFDLDNPNLRYLFHGSYKNNVIGILRD